MNSEAVAPPKPEKASRRRAFRLPREIGILGALVLMLLVLAIFIPQFRNLQNIANITTNFSFVGIVAMGMTCVILTGGIEPFGGIGVWYDGGDCRLLANAWRTSTFSHFAQPFGRLRYRTLKRLVYHPA